jgi:hypothetical protein
MAADSWDFSGNRLSLEAAWLDPDYEYRRQALSDDRRNHAVHPTSGSWGICKTNFRCVRRFSKGGVRMKTGGFHRAGVRDDFLARAGHRHVGWGDCAEPRLDFGADIAERVVLATAIELGNGDLPPTLAGLIQQAPESFADLQLGQIAAVVRNMRENNEAIYFESVGARSGEILFVETQLANGALGIELAEMEAEAVWKTYRRRQLQIILLEGQNTLESNPEATGTVMKNVRDAFELLEPTNRKNWLESRKFNPKNPPSPARSIYSLVGIDISTSGNLTTINAIPKAGKTATIMAMMAATMQPVKDADLLEFRSSNAKKLAVIHFDCEQSPHDHWEQIDKARKRAGVEEPPNWLQSYCLTGLPHADVWPEIKKACCQAVKDHNGIHSIFFDGVADLVGNVNDPIECNAKVLELHTMAIKYDCAIILVIHFNPGTEKSRGHLGSQLERKAETNLRLEKRDEITRIWSDKQRRCPIPKADGPRFQWSDDAGMHVTVASGRGIKEKLEIEDLRKSFVESFTGRPSISYSSSELPSEAR